MADEDRARLQIQMTDLLGPEKYRQLEAYSNADAIRELTGTVAAQLYEGDTPLTAAQGQQLVTAIANLSPDYQNGLRVTKFVSIDWPSVFAQSRATLAPVQEAAFEIAVDQMRTEDQMHTLVHALRQKAGVGQGGAQ
jgi:hypothetical protein